ncbi:MULTISPECIES: hypothetical protein [Flavobacterium]|uniref:hypothetical protein n=1 Tax=Flavobacterium TaxID=237 RepID=UPI001FCC5809|nr:MULTISPECIES: hypothetical protein [Flavobacterium]UOK41583.1 hypothetical protein LZF87_09680 [Flavobacterium enshiense]
MIKFITLLLFFITSQIVKSQPANYKNTQDVTLKDAFPNDHDKLTPGCLGKVVLKDLKQFLHKLNINLDSVKTLHFYYSNHEIECKNLKNRIVDKMYFTFDHSHNVTAVYKPILYIKPEFIEADKIWIDDTSNYFFNLFLKDFNRKFDAVIVTINSKGIYFTNIGYFNPIVFNAFSNEVDKYSCE